MKIPRYLLLSLLLQSTLLATAQESQPVGSQTMQIAGTELAQLPTMKEVLAMLPGVTVNADKVTVVGRGTPAFYIDARKVTELSELRQIQPSRVKEIEVLRHPGAEYDKNVQSVIVIRLKPDETEGFVLDNMLRLDMTHRIAPNDELSLRWRRSRLTLTAFAGWSEEKQHFDRKSFVNEYKDHVLVGETVTTTPINYKKQEVTTRLAMTYDIPQGGQLTASYALYDKLKNRTEQPGVSTVIDHPNQSHHLTFGYTRRLGEWDIMLMENDYLTRPKHTITKPTKTTCYHRREYDLHTYLKASHPLWRGTFAVGAEHDYDHMDVKLYEKSPDYTPTETALYRTHAIHPDNTLSGFVTTSQQFGRWKVEAGLRYEYHDYVYRPCDDDGLMKYIDTTPPSADENRYVSHLRQDREVSFSNHNLFPSLKVSTRLGASDLVLKHTETTVRPDLGITRLRYKDMAMMDDKILRTERASTTAFEWSYQWLHAAVSHFYYDDPICLTLSTSTQYNTDNYHAIDGQFTLSPRIGWWSPVLHAVLHKQWLNMPLANGKDRLKIPYGIVTLNNSLSLPHHWMVRLNAQWHSRGAERNDYHYRTNFRLDASVQKEFPRQHLTIYANANNLLGASYDDYTRYTQAYYSVSEGVRDENVRVFSIALRWHL